MRTAAGARGRLRTVVSALVAAAAAASLVQPLRSQTTSAGSVAAWLTTVDRANLLSPQAALSFAPDSGSTPLTIDIDASTVYQEMDGVGASFTDSSAWLVYNKLSPAQRHDLLVRLFDRNGGIGLSYLRQPIGASDFALSQYSYDDVPAGQTDPGLAHFSIDHDRAYILPVLQEVLSVNPQIRFMATPWSAPGWMKSSGSLIGGSLNAGAEAAYATYLVRFIQAYQQAGVPIDRITVENEPHYTPPDYPGMWMDSPQQAEFIGKHLGPALAAAGLQTRIEAWDHNWNDTTYAPSVLGDATASQYTAGTAWHCYAGAASAMTTVHDLYPGKETLQTECTGGYWTGDFGQSFTRDMDGLVIAAPRNWASTVIKWNVALDTSNGPHTGGCPTCTGLVTIDQATGTVSYNFDYYSLGHLAKFVLPGARRIASNTFSGTIEDVAFRNPDGSTVLVAFNADANAGHAFKVRMAGQSFSYTLPPLGAVTFTWTDTGAGGAPTPTASPNLAQNRPAIASSIESASYPASNAVDGSTTTRWASAFSDPQWLQVDLGSRYTLSRVVLEWELAYAAAYQVQVSDDAATWTTIYSTAAGKGGTETITPTVAAAGRYLRLLCTQRTYVYGQQWGYSLWELQAFGAAAVSTPAASPNLALTRPASASSTESASYPASNAVDCSTTTRWASAYSDAQWLQVDLGGRYTLSSVVLEWELAYAVAYQLQVSDDAATWTTIYSTSAGKGGTETITPTVAAAGRYLRLLCTQRTYVYGQQWGYSLWELQAFGTAAASTSAASANLALTRPASASSTESASYPASNAVDGSTTTRWASAFSDPQWLQVDLGSRYTLSSVVLEWELAYAAAYQVQVSDDAATWTTIYSTSTGKGGTERITPTVAAAGRYLRLLCTQRTYVFGQQWGYSLWELQAFGTPTP